MNAPNPVEIPAIERRRSPRRRALMAGVLHEPNKCSTWSCMIRNLSDDGARLEIANAFWVPNEFGIEITARNSHQLAEVIWKDAAAIGVRLRPLPEDPGSGSLGKLNRQRQARQSLQQRISDLTE